MFAYGPVLLHEVLTAAELLAEHRIDVTVVAVPWLNRFDREWLDGVATSPKRSSSSRITRRWAGWATHCGGS